MTNMKGRLHFPEKTAKGGGGFFWIHIIQLIYDIERYNHSRRGHPFLTRQSGLLAASGWTISRI